MAKRQSSTARTRTRKKAAPQKPQDAPESTQPEEGAGSQPIKDVGAGRNLEATAAPEGGDDGGDATPPPETGGGYQRASDLHRLLQQDEERQAAINEKEQAAMDGARKLWRARLTEAAALFSPCITVLYGGRGHILSKTADLIIYGPAMKAKVLEAMKDLGLNEDDMLMDEISRKDLFQAPTSQVISTITLKNTQR